MRQLTKFIYMNNKYSKALLLCLLAIHTFAQQNLPFNEAFVPITGEFTFPNNWSADNLSTTVVLNPDVNAYGGTDGSGSAMFNLFATQGYTEFNLATPVLANTDQSKLKMSFDFASALRKTVPGNLPFTFPDDVFRIYVSTTGGMSYTLFEEHSLSLNAPFNTGGFVQMAAFTPVATQWITHETVLPEGTNRVLFKIFRPEGNAAGSNHSYLDNVNFEICNTATPEGETIQYDESYITVADLDVTGESLTWYSDQELTTEIPDTTTLVDGTTYYVTSTIDGCESEALAILFDEEQASNKDWMFSQMKVYPNPTKSFLTIDGVNEFTSAHLYDIAGKHIFSSSENSFSVAHIQSGIYLLEIKAGNAKKVQKVIIK